MLVRLSPSLCVSQLEVCGERAQFGWSMCEIPSTLSKGTLELFFPQK